MSHCISVYLLRKEELRDDKISSILDGGNNHELKITELKSGIVALTEIKNIKEFGKDKTIAYITTDYFGGIGNQSAKVYHNNKLIFSSYKEGSIDDALSLMGINCIDGMDEFDTIGLGSYRSNSDF